MDLHDLTAGYALDALDPDERARYEEHLASCESCRAELQEFWQVAGALGRAAGGPTPPASLRDRILEQARDERPNVVPLRRRIAAPVLASAAAVAAVVASRARCLVVRALERPRRREQRPRRAQRSQRARPPDGRRRGQPRRHPDRPCRARRQDAGPGAGGQGLRDLGLRERRPEECRPVRAAGRDDAVAEGRARDRPWQSHSSRTAASTRRRATRSSRPSRRSEPVTKP